MTQRGSGDLHRAPAALRRGHRRRPGHHPGAPETVRNSDVHYEFRQASDFYFLTGFDEPDAVAVFNPAHAKERFVLFVRPRDREMEIWTGHRAGVEGAVAAYGADAAYPIDQLDAKLREYAIDRPTLFYRLGNAGVRRPRSSGSSSELRAARGRGLHRRRCASRTRPDRARAAAAPLAGRAGAPAPRLRDQPRRPHRGHALRAARACTSTRCRPRSSSCSARSGSPRNAYPSIVASGPNACILHYVENTRRMEDGDLLLIDAGCEYGYHAADITRTFPVNGRFTGAPAGDLRGRAAARSWRPSRRRGPAPRYEAVHEAARRVLTEGLVELRLLPRGVADRWPCTTTASSTCTAPGTGSAWTCTTSATTASTRQSRALEPGMVFTVEPGLYFDPERESATYHLREYSEDEMWERRLRLGMAAAKKLEDEEKAKAREGHAPDPRGVPRHRRAHRGRHPGHRRRHRRPHRRHAQDRSTRSSAPAASPRLPV